MVVVVAAVVSGCCWECTVSAGRNEPEPGMPPIPITMHITICQLCSLIHTCESPSLS